MAEELSLCDLRDDMLQLIAASLTLASLCNLGRVNRRLQKFVNEEEQLWQGLFLNFFGTPCSSISGTAKEAFKKEYEQAVLFGAARGDTLVCWGKLLWEAESEDEWMTCLMPRMALHNKAEHRAVLHLI